MNFSANIRRLSLVLAFASWPALSATQTPSAEPFFLSSPVQLIFEGSRSGEGYYSADGKWMTFQSEREAGNPFYQIYLRSMVDGETHRISPGIGKTTCSWLHPAEKKVIFASTHLDPKAKAKQKEELEARAKGEQKGYSWDYDENYDLFVADYQGKILKRLTSTRGYDAEASYSPDGKHIVFASNRSGFSDKLSEEDQRKFAKDPSYMMDLYIMNADGSNVRRLTNTPGYDGGPFFSPDGKKIVWRRFSPDGAFSEIYTMNVDGSGETKLTDLKVISWAPFYHPSGDYLVFASNLSGGHEFELYLIAADGRTKTPVRVTYHPGFDGLPVFSPDGRKLSWASSRSSDGKPQIFTADWDDAKARKALGLSKGKPNVLSLKTASSTENLRDIVEYLASPELEGRMTGGPGEQKAKDFAAQAFGAFGLKGFNKNKSFFEPFDFTSGVSFGSQNQFHLRDENGETLSLKLEKDWQPLSFSKPGAFSGSELVFAGYGLVAPKTKEFKEYDSYAELDVKDKWVMVFRYVPEEIPEAFRSHLNRVSSLQHKAMIARDRGAKGLIIVSGPTSRVKKDLAQVYGDEALATTSLPVLTVSDEVAQKLLGKSGPSLKEYQKTLDKGELKSLQSKREIAGEIDLKRERKTSTNVLAKLESGKKNRPVVIIGAHIDHLGVDGVSSSLAKAEEKGQPHVGADDNASGVAAVLEIARELSQLKSEGKWRPKNDILFALWSGEELGILGSSRFVEDHVKTHNVKTLAYLNMDMIGRYVKELSLQGAGSSTAWATFVEKASANSPLVLNLQNDPYLPTDSTAFYLADVPILSAFTGPHADYHTPRDTADKINYVGFSQVTTFMKTMTMLLAEREQPLPFVKKERAKGPERRGLRIYLGTIPDYTKTDFKGVQLSGVQKAGPAEKAGLKMGDIIVQLAGHKVENLYDYMNIMANLKAGEKTKVVVKRESKEVPIELTPESRE